MSEDQLKKEYVGGKQKVRDYTFDESVGQYVAGASNFSLQNLLNGKVSEDLLNGAGRLKAANGNIQLESLVDDMKVHQDKSFDQYATETGLFPSNAERKYNNVQEMIDQNILPKDDDAVKHLLFEERMGNMLSGDYGKYPKHPAGYTGPFGPTVAPTHSDADKPIPGLREYATEWLQGPDRKKEIGMKP